MTLNKRFCKKVFSFNISFFKKCYVHDIFTINFLNIVNWSYSNIFYSFNIYIYWHAPTTNQPISLFFFFFFVFLPFYLSHKSQPFTFCLLSFSLSLLSSTHSTTQPTPTHFFTLIFFILFFFSKFNHT